MKAKKKQRTLRIEKSSVVRLLADLELPRNREADGYHNMYLDYNVSDVSDHGRKRTDWEDRAIPDIGIFDTPESAGGKK